jgi:hypothetical protein
MVKKFFSGFIQTMKRWLGRSPNPPAPYVGVRVPLRKGPGDRSAAVALQEPDR